LHSKRERLGSPGPPGRRHAGEKEVLNGGPNGLAGHPRTPARHRPTSCSSKEPQHEDRKAWTGPVLGRHDSTFIMMTRNERPANLLPYSYLPCPASCFALPRARPRGCFCVTEIRLGIVPRAFSHVRPSLFSKPHGLFRMMGRSRARPPGEWRACIVARTRVRSAPSFPTLGSHVPKLMTSIRFSLPAPHFTLSAISPSPRKIDSTQPCSSTPRASTIARKRTYTRPPAPRSILTYRCPHVVQLRYLPSSPLLDYPTI
jgi:hypothetical protein